MHSKATRVCLRSTLEDQDSDTHWSSVYYAFKRGLELVDPSVLIEEHDINESDVVIICNSVANGMFPIEYLRDRDIWKNIPKIAVFSTDDSALRVFPGLYTSLGDFSSKGELWSGGFYPHVAFADQFSQFPLDSAMDHL